MSSKIYKVLNQKDCAELGIEYRATERIILAEYNVGHYTITRYPSLLGKILIIAMCPFLLGKYIIAGMWEGIKECGGAVHDTFNMIDRRDFWGDDNKYISYLKEKY